MAFARVSSSPRLTSLRLRIEQKRSCISNARPETDVCANHQLATLPIARQLGSSKKSPAIRTSTQRGTRDRRRQSLPSHNAWRTTLPFPETQTLWGKEREQSQSRTAGKSYRQLATRAGSSGLLQKPPTGQDHVGAKPEAEPPFLDTWGKYQNNTAPLFILNSAAKRWFETRPLFLSETRLKCSSEKGWM